MNTNSEDYKAGLYAGYTKAAEESKIHTDGLTKERDALQQGFTAIKKLFTDRTGLVSVSWASEAIEEIELLVKKHSK
jgi:hypothetical protein